MADWADACRQRQGLAVAPHFPYPTGEIAADIVLGKIDAVEIWPQDDPKVHPKVMEEFDSLRYRDWYHYLNCGYRLPAVAGTDKMGATFPRAPIAFTPTSGRKSSTIPTSPRPCGRGIPLPVPARC